MRAAEKREKRGGGLSFKCCMAMDKSPWREGKGSREKMGGGGVGAPTFNAKDLSESQWQGKKWMLLTITPVLFTVPLSRQNILLGFQLLSSSFTCSPWAALYLTASGLNQAVAGIMAIYTTASVLCQTTCCVETAAQVPVALANSDPAWFV